MEQSWENLATLQRESLAGYAAMARGLIPEYDANTLYIVTGCEITVAGSDYAVTEGYVFYQDEIFKVEAAAFTAPGGEVGVFSLDVTSISTPFADGIVYEVEQTRRVVFTSGLSGSGIADFDETELAHARAGGPFVPVSIPGDLTVSYVSGGFRLYRTPGLITLFLNMVINITFLASTDGTESLTINMDTDYTDFFQPPARTTNLLYGSATMTNVNTGAYLADMRMGAYNNAFAPSIFVRVGIGFGPADDDDYEIRGQIVLPQI